MLSENIHSNIAKNLQNPIVKAFSNNYIYCSRVHFRNLSLQKAQEEEERLVALWCSVINQALIDLKSHSKKPEAKLYYEKAKEWLTGYSDDFLEVCTLAKLNPQTIVNQSWEIIINAKK